jgi:hypothetical protein
MGYKVNVELIEMNRNRNVNTELPRRSIFNKWDKVKLLFLSYMCGLSITMLSGHYLTSVWVVDFFFFVVGPTLLLIFDVILTPKPGVYPNRR